LNGAVSNLDEEGLADLYAGTSVDTSSLDPENIHSLSDLPAPETLKERQRFYENLLQLLNSATAAESQTESESNFPWLAAGAAGVGITAAAGTGGYLWGRRGTRAARAEATTARNEVADAQRELEQERQRQEWIDNNTPINLEMLQNPGLRGRAYRRNIRSQVLAQAQLTGIPSRRQLTHELNRWLQFVLGSQAGDAATRTARLEELYTGLVNGAGNPLHNPGTPINHRMALTVPVQRYGPGNRFTRVEPDFALELAHLMADTDIRNAYEEHLRGIGIALNGGFWRMIENGRISLADLLVGYGRPGGFTEAQRI
jgi:hypothetical protein